MIRIVAASSADAFALVDRRVTRDPGLVRRVRTIVAAVRRGGDAALARYARRFDGLDGDIEVPPEEVRRLAGTAPLDARRAVAACARNIRRVARAQLPRAVRVAVSPGVVIEHTVTPLRSVGCYVPGGRFPLPSSLLMTAIPARVAGVPDIVATCPRVDAVVAAAAIEAGVTRLFRLGGAHAIAALAYGTPRVPRVDKIVGPGNRYVAAAKALVAPDCPIDFEAGPTELVWATSGARPEWVARDLLAQAEHDPDARAFLVTTSRREADAVRDELLRLAPAGGAAAAALAHNGAALVAASRREMLDIGQPHRARAPGDRRRMADCATAGRGNDLRRRLGAPGRRRLRHRVQSRAADGRRGALPRRPQHGRFRARGGRATRHPHGPARHRRPRRHHGPRRGAHGARGVD